MVKIRIVIFFLITFVVGGSALADNIDYTEELDSINNLLNSIKSAPSDKEKIEINNYLIEYFQEFLKTPESFAANFDSIKNLSVLVSEDNMLRVFTWNLNFNDGTFKYFGYLQYKNKSKTNVYFLSDKKNEEDANDRKFQTNSEWYGALYYEIITKKWNSMTYYTLIGWDGANYLINRKVVEVLYFDRKGMPLFGKKIFKLEKTNTGRLIFEYADRTTMILRHNEKQDIIVLDHLSPPEQRFTGMFQYYGPDFSYDALIFRGGKWVLMNDIDPEIAINYKRDSKTSNLKRRGVSGNF